MRLMRIPTSTRAWQFGNFLCVMGVFASEAHKAYFVWWNHYMHVTKSVNYLQLKCLLKIIICKQLVKHFFNLSHWFGDVTYTFSQPPSRLGLFITGTSCRLRQSWPHYLTVSSHCLKKPEMASTPVFSNRFLFNFPRVSRLILLVLSCN